MAAAGVLAGPGVISAGVATRDVPPIFQKIVKLLMHSFYDDLARVICDLLARYACVKEDDIALVLRADKKQVRQTLQSLEKDKIFKKQMLQDPNLALTDADVEGVSEEHLRSLQRRASQRYPYYCIDYAAVGRGPACTPLGAQCPACISLLCLPNVPTLRPLSFFPFPPVPYHHGRL